MKLAFMLLLLLHAPEALAWGLQTHIFFAHYALASLALTDPGVRAAALRFPRLVLAGACIPDLAVVGRLFVRTPAFVRAHRWATLRRIAGALGNDRDRALTLGYATHLLADVVAHNFFVPEHEARIGRGAMIAHLVSEWAMDRHVAGATQPAELIEEAGGHGVEFVARSFRCSEALARKALGVLAQGERHLRRSPVPALCRNALGLVDRRCAARFDSYIRTTESHLAMVGQALAGAYQDWCGSDPEGSEGDCRPYNGAGEHVARVVQAKRDA